MGPAVGRLTRNLVEGGEGHPENKKKKKGGKFRKKKGNGFSIEGEANPQGESLQKGRPTLQGQGQLTSREIKSGGEVGGCSRGTRGLAGRKKGAVSAVAGEFFEKKKKGRKKRGLKLLVGLFGGKE